MSNSTLTFIGKDSGFGDNNNSAYVETNNGEKLILIDCGMTVFNQIKNKFDYNKYTSIEIIITHLHSDHAGSLSQLILYLWFVYNKKVTIVSKCERIEEYLEITGVTKEQYILVREDENIEMIKTEHVEQLDCYGFKMNINNKNIIYTGDTNTLSPFLLYIDEADEIYIDVSKNGGVHLKIDDIVDTLKNIKEKGVQIFLMHMDDKEYIRNSLPEELGIDID